MEKNQSIIWLILLISLVILYWVYLVFIKEKKTTEGFENQIKLLIQSKENKLFNMKIWDNSSYLFGIYNQKGIAAPKNITECIAITGENNTLSSCPISIWRPTLNNGFKSIGDVLTRMYTQPNNEIISDIRKTKLPGAITDKNLDTMIVLGSMLKEPVDFTYVGGFGSGPMINLFQQNDDYARLKIIINNNYKKVYTELTNLITAFNTNIANVNKYLMDAFSDQLYKISNAYSIQPTDQATIDNFKNIYLNYLPTSEPYYKFSNNNMNKTNITTFINFQKSVGLPSAFDNNSIKYTITKTIVNINIPYKIETVFANYPSSIVDDLNKSLNSKNLWPTTIQYTYYSYKFTNLSKIPTYLSSVPNNDSRDYISTIYKPDKLHIIGVNPGKYIDNGHYQDTHYSHNVLPNHIDYDPNYTIKATLDYSFSYRNRYNRRWVYTTETQSIYHSDDKYTYRWWMDDTRTGDENENMYKTILSFHTPKYWWEHPNITEIYTYELTISPYYLKTQTDIALGSKNDNLIKYYGSIVSETQSFMNTNNLINDYNYRLLSIWKPIPPPGYVALGYIFSNADKTEKPKLDLMTCVPQTCVKKFKRRSWLPEDLIFKYIDQNQSLSFYRNPYLNTVVVVDEKINNGEFKDQTPDKMKYSNDQQALNWECFDIVPCIQGNNYIDRLSESITKSKQLCKSFTKLENQFNETDEAKKADQLEEDKMKKVLTDKKQYITDLMKQLDGLMNAEELYKMINQGINRHKMQKDLETRRIAQEKVANKMMKTRGFEISWEDPTQFDKFKEILKRFIVARGINLNQSPKNCPICRLPDTSDFVEINKLKMCYGCVEDVVRQLIGAKKAAGEPIPPELQQLENKMTNPV
jgi:hypothetical protein